jgi:hypothetical protein
MASNYMETIQDLWTSVYAWYERNMSPQRKKNIVLVRDNGDIDSFGFKKKDFIQS